MAFWSTAYLAWLREKIKQSITGVQYKVGSTWSNAVINQVSVNGAQVLLLVNIPTTGNTETITGIRVYDESGNLAGEQVTSITRTGTQNLLLKFEFPLTEV